jgi:putative NADH-flavin reductase
MMKLPFINPRRKLPAGKRAENERYGNRQLAEDDDSENQVSASEFASNEDKGRITIVRVTGLGAV